MAIWNKMLLLLLLTSLEACTCTFPILFHLHFRIDCITHGTKNINNQPHIGMWKETALQQRKLEEEVIWQEAVQQGNPQPAFEIKQ